MPITALDGLTPPSTDDPADFDDRGDEFLAALPLFASQANALEADLNNLITAAFTTTSITPVTIGTGTKTFIVQAGLGYVPGQNGFAAAIADLSKKMVGQVQSYDKVSGQLVFSIPSNQAYGTGNFSSWSIGLAPMGSIPVQRGHIDGLTLSTAGSSASFGIATGEAADRSAFATMALASAYTKTTSAWALGTAAGALDTGTIASNTWYHVHLIQRPDTGVVDVLASLSATSPTLPANYTLSRRIGAMKTDGSSQWKKFVQLGDTFLWAVPNLDVNGANIAASATAQGLASVPTGVSVEAIMNIAVANSVASITSFLVASVLQASQSVGTPSGNASLYVPASGSSAGMFRVMTDGNAQVWVSCSQANQTYINVQGWIDRRGKDA